MNTYLFLEKENSLTIKYLLCIVIGFVLTIYPIFNFEGNLKDNDFLFFISMDFNQYINVIKNNIGLNRIIAFTFEYIIPKIFENIPYKSYIVLIFFYLTYYILCEKILSLLEIAENIRVLIFINFIKRVYNLFHDFFNIKFTFKQRFTSFFNFMIIVYLKQHFINHFY